MKRIALAAVFVLTAVPAFAADISPPPPPPPAAPVYVPAAVYNWSGFYFGLNGGYGFGSTKWTTGALSTGTFDTSGFLIGPTVGFNFQTGAFVFGIEGDLDWATMSGTTSNAPCPTSCQTTNNYVATVRGRVGYAFDRFLVFGTGGAAFSDIKGNVTGIGSVENFQTGWTAGGGVEVAFDRHWTVKAEYLYVAIPNGACACGAPPGAPFTITATENLVRAGLNYKFTGF
jgi:outer membrane immunogenic protein